MTRTTNGTVKYTTLGLLATLAATVSAPVLADQQGDKNNLRNLAIAGAAVAGYGLLNHNNTATLLGAAGAAIAGSQYENVRQRQSQDNGYYGGGSYNGGSYNGQGNGRSYHRTGDSFTGGGFDANRGGYYTNAGRYNSDGSQWHNDYHSNRDWTTRGDDRSYGNGDRDRGGWNGDARRDNGQRDWAARTDQRHDDRH